MIYLITCDMESTKLFLKDLIKNSAAENAAFKRNILKEYLQILVLDYLYSHAVYSRLVFYGGSCLKHLYGLPRLSEDLDFVDLKKEIDLEKLAGDLAVYFKKKHGPGPIRYPPEIPPLS